MGSLLGVTGLSRAVADAVSPVGLTAEAADVTGGAAELGVGNAGHVVGAELSARTKVLGDGDTSNGGKDSEGLHLDDGVERNLKLEAG